MKFFDVMDMVTERTQRLPSSLFTASAAVAAAAVISFHSALNACKLYE